MILHESIAVALRNRLLDEDKSEWLEIHEESIINFSWKYTSRWNSAHWAVATDAIRDWCTKQTDARQVLRACIVSNRRLGVWLTCQVAREPLGFVSKRERRPWEAIRATEAWVKDPSERNQSKAQNAGYRCRWAAYEAVKDFNDAEAYAIEASEYAAYTATADSSSVAIQASRSADAAAKVAGEAVRTPTRAVGLAKGAYDEAVQRELVRLCSVIAGSVRHAMQILEIPL